MNKTNDWVLNFVPHEAQTCILTFMCQGRYGSTAVSLENEEITEVEYPEMVDSFEQMVSEGKIVTVISRNFEKELFEETDERKIPYKTIRAWTFTQGIGDPLDAISLREAFSVNALTGARMEEEPSERYETSWLLTGRPSGH